MQKMKSKFDAFRQKINVIIYGTNTVYGRLFDLVLLCVILLSVIIVMLETVKSFDAKYHSELIILEWIITIFFTLEYVLRIISLKKPWQYIFSFYGIIDLIATLPMYFSLFFAGTSILTVVRALRLLRLFKILKHPQFSSQSIHLKEALLASRGKILIFIYFMLISSIIIGSVMYVVEGPAGGFTSIPISIYWTIVTLTTVGYGDISPITPLGQSIASAVMIMGYGIIAVPTGIVSAEFANSHRKKLKAEKINPCATCGTDGHEFHAKYCFHCGTEL
ncbi:ion transporter [Flavobacterium sp. F-328]|jgi:voltage-gated potassium channel|uniref:Ion transporter n=1 Tax=Flavobacterium erciyesense TaxID=2825842 RepID=A0ABS5D4D6_9FLAO|nr:ion transporter [Flavobacterium erciyesense]MBQ0908879.1 ion transporter [Flavobacterium erciyesense]